MPAPIHVIDAAEAASVMLDPVRAQLLGTLAEPASAAELARRLELPRQRVNYHLRELERVGAVELAERRRKGNCVERVLRRTATSYLVDPTILGQLGESPTQRRDKFSWAYLVSLLAHAIGDLSTLRRRADAAGKRLSTLAVETEVRFSSPQAMHAFAEKAARALADLAAEHHDASVETGRSYRFVLAGLPVITTSEPSETSPDQPPNTESTL